MSVEMALFPLDSRTHSDAADNDPASPDTLSERKLPTVACTWAFQIDVHVSHSVLSAKINIGAQMRTT